MADVQMQVSPKGRAAIVRREGGFVLHAYYDTEGVLTIGAGHTGRMAPPPVVSGMTITQDQAEAFLEADLAPVEACLNGLDVPLGQNQFDALASLAFNIGLERFGSSTLVKELKGANYAAAAQQILLWDKPHSIEARRVSEQMQFLAPDALA